MNSLVLLPFIGSEEVMTVHIKGKEYDIEDYLKEMKYNDLFQCSMCAGIIHVTIKRDQPNAKFNIINESEFHERIRIVSRTPKIFKPDKWDEKIPLTIRKDLAEANTAFSIYLFNASMLLLRRTLEQVTKEKEAEGKNLFEKINNLLKNEQRLLLLAENVRIFGNLAAHDEQAGNLSEEDIKDLIAFVEHFLDAMYVIPAKISEMKRRRSSF